MWVRVDYRLIFGGDKGVNPVSGMRARIRRGQVWQEGKIRIMSGRSGLIGVEYDNGFGSTNFCTSQEFGAIQVWIEKED